MAKLSFSLIWFLLLLFLLLEVFTAAYPVVFHGSLTDRKKFFRSPEHIRYVLSILAIIIILSRHQHGYPWPTLATRSSLLSGPQGYIPYPHWTATARPCEGVHRRTSLMISSLLLQQCPACLVRLTWIVFVMGGRWPNSCCFVECCLQDVQYCSQDSCVVAV